MEISGAPEEVQGGAAQESEVYYSSRVPLETEGNDEGKL